MLQECKGILKQVASNGEVENLWITISCVQLKRLKSLNFGGPRLGDLLFIFAYPKNFKPTHPGTSDFCRIKVLPDVSNRSNFEYSAFSGLKVDSGRRKRMKKNAKHEKQYSSWGKRA